MSDAQLEILASRAGLAVDWIDANGRPQKVEPRVLRAVLAGLGHPAGNDQEIERSLQQLQQRQQGRHLPPLLTADVGQGLDLARYFPAQTQCRVQLEDGSSRQLQLDDESRLPGELPVGYHSVDIEDERFILAVAPERCYSVADAVADQPPRAWGLGVQLYALRRSGDGGFGDTQALEELARQAAERGADALAISPLHAMFSCDPRRYSPYSPSSRLFLNSLYAAPGTILGERAWRTAIEACGLGPQLQALEQQPLIDWPAAAQAKQQVLRELHQASAMASTRCTRTSPAIARLPARPWKTIVVSRRSKPCGWPVAKIRTGAIGRSTGATRPARNWHAWPRSKPRKSTSMRSANG
ncbi:hypothetical protein P308_14880 [Pseudomonas piscis]|nr:hypothetical protein P308_14880 [Pseudomonas piscis]